ncbi:MAG: hypothetical protein H0X37_11955 [Herpetosiphonaceae bacterium]|nr:hypothetical protein [Herpetosiphonaceae bacterium]
MSQTSYNYTGQRKDATGLLYYHARQYNPMTGKFGSPDSIVPGAASASGGGAATLGGGSTTPLTVDFHEPGFAAQLNRHNAATGSMGFWFQLSDEEQQEAESPMGPANPQALNRYSYVLNNPLRYTDPTGHCAEPISCGLEAGAGGFFVCGPVCGAAGLVGAAILAGVAIGYAYHLATIAKPLTHDEKSLIDDIEQIPDFLNTHPDIAAEAAAQEAGATLAEDEKDHVDEAWQRVESLEKAIRHLSSVRKNRNLDAQREIDGAVQRANNYLDRLLEALVP